MLWLILGTQVLTLGIVASGGSQPLAAQTQSQPQTPASILAQVREATGGEAWERIDELRTEGTVLVGGKTGTIATFENLRTGANADRVDLEGVGRVENHADMPGQNWEQDEAGDVLLTPGGKEPGDIDDLYIHRNGWWEASFGGATATLLPPATDEGVTYDLLRIKVPGGTVLRSGLIALVITSIESPTATPRPSSATFAILRVV
jgi:hypothetical protein